MIEALLTSQITIGITLLILILLQNSSSDALSGLGNGSGFGGVVTAKTANKFFTKVTSIIIAIFMINALILANFSHKKSIQTRSSDINNNTVETVKEEDVKR